MARKLRVQYSGAIYHLINRGDRKEAIFKGDADRHLFLDTLGEACEKTAWHVVAYCLMRNHFHLVIETPRPNLVAGMKWLLGTYTSRFNRRHKLTGHLFAGRYKALIVDGSGNGYLRTISEYVHLNPVRAGLILPSQKVATYRWSSYPLYLSKPAQRPVWLRVERVLGECGIPKDSPAGRRQYQRLLEERRRAGEPAEHRALRRGWYLGDEVFRKELLGLMTAKGGGEHYGQEIREREVERAERVVAEELKRLKWKDTDLERVPKCAPEKVQMAARLRRESAMTLRWIASRLRMGAPSTLNNRLYWRRRGKV